MRATTAMASVTYLGVNVLITGTRRAPVVSIDGRAHVRLSGGAEYNTRAEACAGAYVALDDDGADGHALVIAVAPDGKLTVAWCYTRTQLREAGCSGRLVDTTYLTSHVDTVEPEEVTRVLMVAPTGAAPSVYDMARGEFSQICRAKYEKIAASTLDGVDVFATQHGKEYSQCVDHAIEPHVRAELCRLYASQWFVDLSGTQAQLSSLDRCVALCNP